MKGRNAKYQDKKANMLIHENSPYLLQHAYNPVDWHPWTEKAFSKAKKEKKPVFLSIGYSTCHWCHVMEKESFENEDVARLMNENFISIKVDREERPDIDSIYMTVCQALTGRGGWPLTIIMTPDKEPFIATTYIPKESRPGLTGMMDFIPLVGKMWNEQRDELVANANEIINALSSQKHENAKDELDIDLLERTYQQLKENFDSNNAGFGNAPKFPTPHYLTFLLRYWKRNKDPQALEMVERTLQAMRKGGIYDHVGHGFHRYSTDQYWLAPHFEKMLYDQALLAIAYTEAYHATKKPEYKKIAEEIFTYAIRDMRADNGGFFSAEDADSEGEEGKFYTWTESELSQILDQNEFRLIKNIFNTKAEGNFFDEGSQRITGTNILHLKLSIEEFAIKYGKDTLSLKEELERIREKLFAVRNKRIHPLKDDKIMTDWNGLMIAALSKASRAFNNDYYREVASETADFIVSTMIKDDGILYHRFREEEVSFKAFLEDYVFLIWGLIELYQTDFDNKYLKTALELNHELVKHFWDIENNGFFHTRDDSEKLIFRNKEVYDGATPSGNSVAALNLLQLGRITSDPKLEEMARKTMNSFSREISGMGIGYTQLMSALDFATGPSTEIVIVGKRDQQDKEDIISCINEHYIPNKVVIFKSVEEENTDLFSDGFSDMEMKDGKTTVHICQNYNCDLPLNDKEKIHVQLEKL